VLLLPLGTCRDDLPRSRPTAPSAWTYTRTSRTTT